MANNVPQNPGELNKRVETLAKDLVSKGYWSLTYVYSLNTMLLESYSILKNKNMFFLFCFRKEKFKI